MAAITPSSLLQASFGSVSCKIAKFVTTTVDSGDTWSSGLTDIVDIIPIRKNAGSTGSTTGISVSFTASDGTISMFPASENSVVTLMVLHGGAY